MAKVSEMDQLGEVERRMVAKYPGVPKVRVSRGIAQVHNRFAGSRIRDFVPLRVERHARAESSPQGIAGDEVAGRLASPQ